MNDETRDTRDGQPERKPEQPDEAEQRDQAKQPDQAQKPDEAKQPDQAQESEEAQERDLDQIQVLPLVALRDTVIFPEMIVPLQVGRDRSVKALDRAVRNSQPVALITQRSSETEEIGSVDEMFAIGTLAKIAQVIRLQDGTIRAIVQGQRRVRLLDLVQTDPHLEARVELVADEEAGSLEVEALMASVQAQIEQYVSSGASVPPEVAVAARNITDGGLLADMVAYSPEMSTELRQQLLETINVAERLRMVSAFLAKQIEVLELKGKIQSEVKSEMDKTQREYILREQMKAIQKELGEDDPAVAEASELRTKVEESAMPDEVKEKALKEVDRLARIPSASPEQGVIRTYVDWLVSLPWGVETADDLDLAAAEKVLDEDHYGLEKPKERIVEYMAVRKLAEKIRSPILLFVGPPGVGKTSLGKSIARAMGRKFVRMSLGGIHDEAEIRGHRRTYIGALPGRVIQSIKTAGSANPVFMLDEIDKVGMDFRGDPSSALLEVLDPEQNNTFQDNYLEVPFDLSKVLFIATANMLDTIPAALRDRMEVILLPGYTQLEKLRIAQRFLMPKQLENHGLSAEQLEISEPAMVRLIQAFTKEAGVRNLEREIANLSRKVARRVADDSKVHVTVEPGQLEEYLGPARFEYGELDDDDQVGMATGLVVSDAGGDIVQVEATRMDGKDDFILTGQLGDVMKESARAGMSYIRARTKQLGIDPANFEKQTLHIHVPAGATPKDGPSAGVTMATAMASLLTGQAVRRDLAMTGEITLRGRVLPIGGLKSKLLAAHLAGVKTVLIPKRNEKDLVDVPEEIREQLRIIGVETMDEVLSEALIAEARPAARIKAERAARQKRVAPRRRGRKPEEEEAPVAATPKPKPAVEQPPAGAA
jgi:ATP-dependent Lon protease